MNILLVSVHSSSFVKGDIEILESKHNVTYFNYTSIKNIYQLIKIFAGNELVFFWFASIHFLIPLIIAKIFRKKIIIVAGGYDVAKVIDISYGSMNNRVKGLIVRSMLISADKIISVSNSNKNEIIRNCKISPDKIEMVYHGLKRSGRMVYSAKRDIAVTIAFINESSFYRKGIDRFIELAKYLPDIDFHIIGEIGMNISSLSLPRNVVTHGYLHNQELIDILNSAKVYIQFSRHEGFGYSVAEAMIFGCVPVVSNIYSLPEVVGDCGTLIDDFNDYHSISEKVLRVFKEYSEETGSKCSHRIEDNFSFEKRASKLLTIISDFTS